MLKTGLKRNKTKINKEKVNSKTKMTMTSRTTISKVMMKTSGKSSTMTIIVQLLIVLTR